VSALPQVFRRERGELQLSASEALPRLVQKMETSGSKEGAFRFQFSRLSFPARFLFRLPCFPVSALGTETGNEARSASLPNQRSRER
jgi:hypothetical protein